jgi:hypothetical protein
MCLSPSSPYPTQDDRQWTDVDVCVVYLSIHAEERSPMGNVPLKVTFKRADPQPAIQHANPSLAPKGATKNISAAATINATLASPLHPFY